MNPATGETLSVYNYMGAAKVEESLKQAWDSYQKLQKLNFQQRAGLLMAATANIQANRESLARLITLEMGKPIKDSLAEIDKSIFTLTHLAGSASSQIGLRRVQEVDLSCTIRQRPLGPILAIMPWNFPVWQLVRVLGPAVLNGCPVLLKHSDGVAGVAELLTGFFSQPEPLLLNLRLAIPQIEAVIADSRIKAVTLTGSLQAGSAVGALAGRYLKKSVLELGGSDPYLVFEDADLEKAAILCAKSRLINNGQSCISAKRFYIHQAVFEDFIELFQRELQSKKIGSPLNSDTELGPLASAKQLLLINDQVEGAKQEGLVEIFRRSHQQNAGSYSDLVVLKGRGQEKAFVEEEFFGPVALLASFNQEAEAIRLANQSIYGLGAAVFCAESHRAKRIGQELEVGLVAWNDFVRSDVRFPFGGFKFSGYGRELGVEGFQEFLGTQTFLWDWGR